MLPPILLSEQWKQYTVFRMDIKDRATQGKKFEVVYGFHGSDEETLKKIVQQGVLSLRFWNSTRAFSPLGIGVMS